MDIFQQWIVVNFLNFERILIGRNTIWGFFGVDNSIQNINRGQEGKNKGVLVTFRK